MSVQSFVQKLIQSLGLKRKLVAAFQVIAAAVSFVPQLAPFASILHSIAAYLGIVAIGHAAVSNTLSKVPLSTIAAFFAALVAASKTFLPLAPYAQLFQTLSVLFSTLAGAFGVGRLATKPE